jgi:hypothetical protein
MREIKMHSRVYWDEGGRTVGGFVGEILTDAVVVSTDKVDPDAIRLIVAKRDLI